MPSKILRALLLNPVVFALLLSSCSATRQNSQLAITPPPEPKGSRGWITEKFKASPAEPADLSSASAKKHVDKVLKAGQVGTRLNGRVTFKGPTQPVESAMLNGYLLEIFPEEDEQPSYLVFSKNGVGVKRIEAKMGERLALINAEEDGAGVPVCKLTDEKDPNAVVMHFFADHDCECLVFSLGKKLRLLDTIYCNGSSPIFDKIAHTTQLEICVTESFGEWGAHADEQAVLLKWERGKFSLDKKRLAESFSSTKGMEGAIREEFTRLAPDPNTPITFAPPELADQVIKLYYCGEGARAKQYFNRMWPKATPGKAKYWSFLMAEMHNSPNWRFVRAANQGAGESLLPRGGAGTMSHRVAFGGTAQ